MHFIAAVLISVGLFFLSNWLLPWWGVVAVVALVGFALQMGAWASFFAGLLSLGGFWTLHAYWLDSANEGALSAKIAEVLSLPDPSYLLIATGILGALLGAFGMLSGKFFRDLLFGPPPRKQRKTT